MRRSMGRLTPIAGRRPRVPDVARAAGVGPATVDRVLNERPGVRRATAQRVLRAAAALGYVPEADAAAALRPAPAKLLFLLPTGTNRFLHLLGDWIDFSDAHWSPYNVKCRVRYFEGFSPQALAESLVRYGRRADGIAFFAIDHPEVRGAVSVLADKGIPVLTLISDLSRSRRIAYVGLDNRAAGRTAGYLLARFIGRRAGKVALIAGSRSYRAHEEREMGFLHAMEEMAPSMEVIGLREGHDDAERNYRQTRQLLAQHPDLVGIYNIGGASDGVGRALKEAARDHKVVFVGHGLSPDTRGLLIDGTMDAVITQDPQSMVAGCVRIFANLRERREALAGVEPARISLVLRENLP
jgi:LacI family transcriptional regulator